VFLVQVGVAAIERGSLTLSVPNMSHWPVSRAAGNNIAESVDIIVAGRSLSWINWRE